MNKRTILLISLPIIIIAISLSIYINQRVLVNELYPELTLEELVEKSDIIVIGKVTNIKEPILVYSNNDKRLPLLVTDIVISIDRVLTNNYNGREITIRTLGDNRDSIDSFVEDEIQFKEGEDVLLFINSDARDIILKDRYYISGGEQGVFKIRDNMAYNMKYKDGIAVEELVNKIYYYKK
jgi:hypothetical protein